MNETGKAAVRRSRGGNGEMNLGIDTWMVAWNAYGTIRVGPWPDETGWSHEFYNSLGCCFVDRHKMSLEGKVMMMFIDFHSIVTFGGISPLDAHHEFLKIDEYRWRIPPDTAGAEERPCSTESIF